MRNQPATPVGGSEIMTCPLCGKPTVEKYRLFCSRLCADHDLINWIDGNYAIPASDEEPEEVGDDNADAPIEEAH